MSLAENYLMNNGYDYFGNAAEDTLVFFVRDEDAPYATLTDDDNDDEVDNIFDNSLKVATGTIPTPGDNPNDDDISGSIPAMAPADTKQTGV